MADPEKVFLIKGNQLQAMAEVMNMALNVSKDIPEITKSVE